jgi:hypothetical protein
MYSLGLGICAPAHSEIHIYGANRADTSREYSAKRLNLQRTRFREYLSGHAIRHDVYSLYIFLTGVSEGLSTDEELGTTFLNWILK